MASNRLETLKNLVQQNPDDTFAHYGLAMEYVNVGDLEHAATEFRVVIAANPNYSYAYFHGGRTLERLGRVEEAREMYQNGVDNARRSGDQKALSELSAALDLLPL
jgi:tetratricopeptide (TPR) repeat protein